MMMVVSGLGFKLRMAIHVVTALCLGLDHRMDDMMLREFLSHRRFQLRQIVGICYHVERSIMVCSVQAANMQVVNVLHTLNV